MNTSDAMQPYAAHFIEHIVEPDILYLTWQAAELPKRRRFLVAELHRHSNNEVELIYLFDTEDFHAAQKIGFTGFPGFSINTKSHQQGVFDALMYRLPPRKRNDFSLYLESLRLAANVNISDFALLGYSGAKLASDSFAIINPFLNAQAPFEFLIEAAGFRYRDIPLTDITLGSSAHIELEPENPEDPNAIKIIVDHKNVGNVTRALIPTFKRLFDEKKNITAWVELKKESAGKPELYLFVKVV